MKKLIIFIFLLTILSCEKKYLIDNPADEILKVYIDDKEYELKAKEYIKIDLKKGVHKISAEKSGKKILDNENFEIKDIPAGLINPAKNEYIIYNIIYAKNPDIMNEFQSYEIDGKEVYSLLGEPEITDSLFIEDRTLGKGNIDKKPPKTMKITGKYTFLMKIFRKDDFFQFYNENIN